MGLAESLPLPRHWIESEEMAKNDGVGTGVGDDDDPLIWVIECPEMTVLGLHRMDSM